MLRFCSCADCEINSAQEKGRDVELILNETGKEGNKPCPFSLTLYPTFHFSASVALSSPSHRCSALAALSVAGRMIVHTVVQHSHPSWLETLCSCCILGPNICKVIPQ